MMNFPCRICGNTAGNDPVPAREMMFGSREAFPYFLCSACGCLQIEQIPADMARHYPPEYYSYASTETESHPAWKKKVRAARLRYFLEGKGEIGRLASRYLDIPAYMEQWFGGAGLRPGSRILEAGCGQGHLLRQMAGWGFTNLTGADPFVEADLTYPDGVRVFRKSLEEMPGLFDFIMMHHAFEHMPDPYATLIEVRRLLARQGKLLLRIPLASSEAWRTYREDWVQLDAPRHFYLHSRKSMELAAKRSGFTVERVVYDSTAFQFWGSEQYRNGIPLFSPESHAVDPAKSPFTQEAIQGFEERARALNAQGDGDQACFILGRSV